MTDTITDRPLDTQTLLVVNVHSRRYLNGLYRCLGSAVEDDGATFDLARWGQTWEDAVSRMEQDVRGLFWAIRPDYAVRFVHHSGDDEEREDIDQ